ncbi:hypothetical protein [Peterkaempfera griseoplana]|uniref:hypothetical protein n=1 Tax=Peterkaempfera griseoplana TaxID=66896 RepID=UPI0006E17275|nr:hypothetical protein [Peterkaempfera griseoplana]
MRNSRRSKIAAIATAGLVILGTGSAVAEGNPQTTKRAVPFDISNDSGAALTLQGGTPAGQLPATIPDQKTVQLSVDGTGTFTYTGANGGSVTVKWDSGVSRAVDDCTATEPLVCGTSDGIDGVYVVSHKVRR